MGTFLLVVVLASGAWPGQDADTRVQDILSRFRDDSVEVRERAAEDLLALGEKVEPALRLALLEPRDEESRGRIQAVLDRFAADRRRRDFKGGKPVDGLAASLEAQKVDGSEEYSLRIRIMNIGLQPRPLVLINHWSTSYPRLFDSSSGAEATARIEQLTGDQSGGMGGVFG